MGIFTDANGDRKNVLLIKAFSLSILFIIIFVLAYMLSADTVAQSLGQDTGSPLLVWLPPILISLAASAFCCGLFAVFSDKLLIPAAFSFFGVYFIICVIALYTVADKSLAAVGTQFLCLYLLPPILTGNLMSWGIYWLINKSSGPRKSSR
jgi:hypothetical protein